MRRFIILITLLVSLLSANAKNIVAQDDFNENKWGWEEYSFNDCKIAFEKGYMLIENESENPSLHSITDFPAYINKNYKLYADLIIPKINDSFYFGFIFNFEDSNNYSAFMLTEGMCKIINVKSGVTSIVKQTSVLLKSGKNQKVNLLVEKKGPKLYFTVNGVEYISCSKFNYDFAGFGFIVEGENSIKVDNVKIEQRLNK